MKTLIYFIVVSMIFTNCGISSRKDAENSGDESISSVMKAHAEALLLDPKLSSLSIGIYKDGKTYIGHYGELDKGQGNAPTDSTIYEIASVSKTFAGTLVAQAVWDEKLDLEDDIREYLADEYPNLLYDGHPIRVRHLLTHTAELPKFLPDTINRLFENIDETLPFRINEIEKKYSKKKFLDDLHKIVIDTVPGYRYSYSNADTELIALILEKVYQKNYDELLQEYFSEKAGMTTTKIHLNEEEKEDLANGYGETNKLVPHMSNTLWGAGGGVKSTIPDLIKYMKFQLDEGNEASRLSHQPLKDYGEVGTGYYWPIHTNDKDGTYFSHHGGAFGMQNWFFVIPKHNLGLSIFTNQSDPQTAQKLMDTVTKLLNDIR